MLLIDRLAEQQILDAMGRGAFDDLPGQGRPIALDDDSAVPEELWVAYRILRNAGCLPPEQALRREIREVEDLLEQAETETQASAAGRRLRLLKTRLALQGREGNLLFEEWAYREKLLRRLHRND